MPVIMRDRLKSRRVSFTNSTHPNILYIFHFLLLLLLYIFYFIFVFFVRLCCSHGIPWCAQPQCDLKSSILYCVCYRDYHQREIVSTEASSGPHVPVKPTVQHVSNLSQLVCCVPFNNLVKIWTCMFSEPTGKRRHSSTWCITPRHI